MASRTNKSTQNQGPRLRVGRKAPMTAGSGGIRSQGRNPTVPRRPKLAANIKNSQGIGGGLKIGNTKIASNRVQSATSRGPKRGVNQSANLGTKPGRRTVGRPGATNLRPVKQPKKPMNNRIQPKNNYALHNSVSQADVTRLRKASSMPVPTSGGGGFKNFIGGN